MEDICYVQKGAPAELSPSTMKPPPQQQQQHPSLLPPPPPLQIVDPDLVKPHSLDRDYHDYNKSCGGDYLHYDDDEDLGSDYSDSSCPPWGKRLAPVGANAEDEEDNKDKAGSLSGLAMKVDHFQTAEASAAAAAAVSMSSVGDEALQRRLAEMEEEQEELNTSLMAMTSHFAKVQLRLQQVVSAPSDRREELLKQLERFAFKGIPNLTSPRKDDENNLREEDEEEGEDDDDDALIEGGQGHRQKKELMVSDQVLEAQRKKQAELIIQLKGQLEELESYAYESGEAIVPSNMLLERQRIVMEQLKCRLNLNMDNIVKLSEEELKAEVDSAVGQIVNPLKMKNHLVGQLKTQITDLEMFIEFLQSETVLPPNAGCNGCGCSKHNSPTHPSDGNNKRTSKKGSERMSKFRSRTKSEQEEIRRRTVSILERALAVLQLTAVSQFGCGVSAAQQGNKGEPFYKNTLKRTTQGNHYGDLRARLEMAVDHLLESCSQVECVTDSETTSVSSSTAASSSTDLDSQPEYLTSSPSITVVVRKELAMAIRDLIQHGMVQGSGGSGGSRRGSSLVPFMGCMSGRSSSSAAIGSSSSVSSPHAWDVVVRFYKLKQGQEFNTAPQRKLSQSFGLDLAGANSNNKQALLATVGQILQSHGQYKRSADAHFKAFVCAGLNKRKLIPWLKLILRNQTILETFYQPWSYVIKTGFDDGIRAIDRLSIYVFDLPVNVAVRQFQDMSEAF